MQYLAGAGGSQDAAHYKLLLTFQNVGKELRNERLFLLYVLQFGLLQTEALVQTEARLRSDAPL